MEPVKTDALREQLLSIAARHFSQNGYAATKLSDISREAGVSRGPLYYYFSDKAELYTETTKYAIGLLETEFTRIFDFSRPVAEVMRDEFNFCLSIGPQFYYQEPNVKGMPDVSPIVKAYSNWLIEKKYQLFQHAKETGQLRADCDISELISLIYVFYHGIVRIRALSASTDGFSPSLLENGTDYFMKIVEERYLA